MLFQDLSCTADITFRELGEKGLFDALRVEGSMIAAISNRYKVAVSGTLDRAGLGKALFEEAFERRKRDIFGVTGRAFLRDEDSGLFMAAIHISTRERFRVFVVYMRRDAPFTEEEAGWAHRFTQLYYEKVLLVNESFQDKEYIDNIFESTEAAILTFDLKKNLVACNSSANRLFNLRGSGSFWAYEPCNRQFFEAVGAVAQTGEKSRIDYLPFSFCDRKLLLSTAISPLRNSKKSVVGVVAVCYDVTEHRLMEHTMDQLKQYALLGEVGAGLAHDIKNPLTAIRGCAKLLTMPDVTPAAQARAAAVILHEVQRIDQTINQTLTFGSSASQEQVQWLQVNDILEGCIQLAERQKQGRDILFTRAFASELPLVRGKHYSLQQVFLNVMTNAVQSIERKGCIHVSSSFDAAKNEIVVEIRDTGVGMSRDVAEQIYNPYFTTKTDGTGMGLFVVKRVLQRYGGAVALETGTGTGSTFRISLPVSNGRGEELGEARTGG